MPVENIFYGCRACKIFPKILTPVFLIRKIGAAINENWL